MHFHLPKPLHGWRQFIGEVGVIVLGILIALGLEELVRSYHESKIAEEARNNVRAEAAMDLGFLKRRFEDQPCLERRVNELTALLERAGEGPLDPPPQWIGFPIVYPMFVERWHAATASGRNSLFEAKEQDLLDQIYGVIIRASATMTHEQQVWARLRALENWQGPLGPVARLSFAEGLQEARYDAWDLHAATSFALKNAERLGIRPVVIPDDAQAGKDTRLCLPMTTSHGEAEKRFGKGP